MRRGLSAEESFGVTAFFSNLSMQPAVTGTPTLADGREDPAGLQFALVQIGLASSKYANYLSEGPIQSCKTCILTSTVAPNPALTVRFNYNTSTTFVAGTPEA
jgi:hypothetical protein